jgi:hypothetical protein
MSRERELLSSIIDMLERSELSGLEYAILDGETVCANDLINAANKELAKPEPEPLGYVHHEMFAGFVKEPGDASMSCVKLLIPESGYTVPVYAEPTANKPLPEPFTYIGPSAFEKLSSGYAMSVFCAKQAINKSDIPLYAEPQASKREESYSDALRSLASYVGCGGYNADDPIDAKEFEEKIRLGIDLLLSAESQPCVRKPLSDDEPQVINLLTESTQSSAKKYFSYDPYDGFELYDTEDEAKAAAQRVLDGEREEAYEGWSEDVDKIFWGEIRQHVVETMNRPRTDADHVDSEFATIVDYGLVDIGGDNGNT